MRIKGKCVLWLALVVVIFSPQMSKAAPRLPQLPQVWDAGVCVGQSYQEMTFITGEPILVTGTVTVRAGQQRNNKMESTYSYRLENLEKEVKLDRQLTITTFWEEQAKGATATNEVSRIRETVSVGRDRFVLDDKRSLINASSVTLHEPAVSYFAGNLEGRKVYAINRNEGQVILETKSDCTGYEQVWGKVEIQNLYGTISYDRIEAERNPRQNNQSEAVQTAWNGTFTSQISHSTKLDLKYVENEPAQISFAGGFLKTQADEAIMHISYDLPRLDEHGLPLSRRLRQTKTINLTGTPKMERLAVPQYSDIQGRWSQSDAILLGSLKAFDIASKYFHPSALVNRREFALALANVLVLEAEEIDTSVRSKNRNAPPVESAYLDIDVLDPDWPLLKVITDKKIMEGTDVGYFGPDAHVTRAQAVTAFIRALGFENIAPFGSAYYIGFSDDHDIPLWAKNSFNVARQIGLVTGDTFGRARPGAYLTREEAASMLSRLITYLRTEILRDYRDRILLYK